MELDEGGGCEGEVGEVSGREVRWKHGPSFGVLHPLSSQLA